MRTCEQKNNTITPCARKNTSRSRQSGWIATNRGQEQSRSMKRTRVSTGLDQTLSTALLCHVASFLSLHEHYSFAESCKLFRDICNTNSSSAWPPHVSVFNDFPPPALLGRLLHTTSHHQQASRMG